MSEKRTLGYYRDLCAKLGGEQCRAVQWLDDKITHERDGRNAQVLADDAQMVQLLGPMIFERARSSRRTA